MAPARQTYSDALEWGTGRIVDGVRGGLAKGGVRHRPTMSGCWKGRAEFKGGSLHDGFGGFDGFGGSGEHLAVLLLVLQTPVPRGGFGGCGVLGGCGVSVVTAKPCAEARNKGIAYPIFSVPEVWGCSLSFITRRSGQEECHDASQHLAIFQKYCDILWLFSALSALNIITDILSRSYNAWA